MTGSGVPSRELTQPGAVRVSGPTECLRPQLERIFGGVTLPETPELPQAYRAFQLCRTGKLKGEARVSADLELGRQGHSDPQSQYFRPQAGIGFAYQDHSNQAKQEATRHSG